MRNMPVLQALSFMCGTCTVAAGAAAWFATGSATVTVAVAAVMWAVWFTLIVRRGTDN
jgi:hypothetical protein